jgi:hypothetical protein
MLTAHSAVASVAEPWILLPLAAVTGEGRARTYSEFSNRLAVRAVEEFISELPGGKETYLAAMRDMIGSLYQHLCRAGEPYFLDKTPRYYLIVDFLAELFPDAKLIFLFRNPLDVLSSLITTSTDNRLRVHHTHVDLYAGPQLLHEAHRQYSEGSLTIYYERLVSQPEETSQQLTAFLDLNYEPAMVTDYGGVTFHGSMGDRTGDTKYDRPDTASVGRWKGVLDTVPRRAFARRYLEYLGPHTLETFGVSLDGLLQELSELSPTWRYALRDTFWLGASWAARHGAVNVLRRQRDMPARALHKLD